MAQDTDTIPEHNLEELGQWLVDSYYQAAEAERTARRQRRYVDDLEARLIPIMDSLEVDWLPVKSGGLNYTIVRSQNSRRLVIFNNND